MFNIFDVKFSAAHDRDVKTSLDRLTFNMARHTMRHESWGLTSERMSARPRATAVQNTSRTAPSFPHENGSPNAQNLFEEHARARRAFARKYEEYNAEDWHRFIFSEEWSELVIMKRDPESKGGGYSTKSYIATLEQGLRRFGLTDCMSAPGMAMRS